MENGLPRGLSDAGECVKGLDEYDAVAYFDNDIEFQGDITPLLRCASTGPVSVSVCLPSGLSRHTG